MEVPNFILIEETILKYGYNPNFFKGEKDYKKLVVRTCFECNNVYDQKFIYSVQSFKKNKKCKYCSNRENAQKNIEEKSKNLKDKYRSGELVHPMLGKKHTDKSKKLISEKLLGKSFEEKFGKERSDEIKEKLSKLHSGENNHFYGKKHSDESISKMKEIHKKIARRGKDCHFYGKVYHPKRIKYEKDGIEIFFRSTWEFKVANFLTNNNIEWFYESKIFEMVIDGKETTYTPDFYLPQNNTIIEVKGYWREDAIKKHHIFIKDHSCNFNIEVWDKDILKMKKIL